MRNKQHETRLRKFAAWRSLVIALALLAPNFALAEQVPYQLRWRAPQGSVTSYRLYVGKAHATYGMPIELGMVAANADGIATRAVAGFDPTVAQFVVLTAVGPGGESAFSNELQIPPTVCASNCDDGNPCTADLCDKGTCVSTAASNGMMCSDGNAQTENDVCANGVCKGEKKPSAQSLPPGSGCTSDAECRDTNMCNGAEKCVNGSCVVAAALSCEGPEQQAYKLRFRAPSGSISGYRFYIGTGSMSYAQPVEVKASAPDAEGVATASIAGFDTSLNSYVAMTAVGPGGESVLSNEIVIPASRCTANCESGNVCTALTCSGGNCAFAAVADGAACSDNNANTIMDRCTAGVCKGSTPQCTTNANCSDNNACNGVEQCVNFQCKPGAALSCGPVAACQTGRCDALLGCVSMPMADGASCNDGNNVTRGDTCQAGVCVGGAAMCMADADCASKPVGVCQQSVCDQTQGCMLKSALDGTDCDDKDPETTQDACKKGVCKGKPICSPVGALGSVRLSWTADPAHSMTLLWDGPKRTTSRVRVRPAGGQWAEFPIAPTALDGCQARYAMEVGDLQPVTQYEYGIEYENENGPIWTDTRKFLTPPAAGPGAGVYTTAFFASMGLQGAPNSPDTSSVINALASFTPNLVIGGGGYAYSADAASLVPTPQEAIQRWFKQLAPFSVTAPFLPVYGETEMQNGETLAFYRSRHLALDGSAAAPGSYSFDVGLAHYVALHAPTPAFIDASKPEGKSHLQWLQADLTDARERGMRFPIVYMHVDPYSSHPAAAVPAAVRDAFTALLEAQGVRLVISGDNPGVERSHPMQGGVPHPSDLFIDPGEGTIYLRDGSGGREDYRSWAPDAALPEWAAFRDARRKSFVLMHQIDSTNIIVQVVGIPNRGGAPGAPIMSDMFVLR